LLFSNPHKYGRAITVRFTPIRVVCNNTLTFALEGKQNADTSVSINHRKTFNAEEVKKTLQIATTKLEHYEASAKLIASVNYDDKSLAKYLNMVFPKASYERKTDRKTANDNTEMSRPAQTALAAMETQAGVEFGHGTFWQAFNACTFTTDHLLGRSVDSRLHSAWFGINQGRKLRAMDLAVKFAEGTIAT